VLNGRYGPYITDKSRNAKIPKDKDPKSLTLEECQALLAAAPVRTFGKWGKKNGKAATKGAMAAGKAANGAPAAAKTGATAVGATVKGAASTRLKVKGAPVGLAAKAAKTAASKKAPAKEPAKAPAKAAAALPAKRKAPPKSKKSTAKTKP
jgi:DNA topoisomerase I